ASRPAQVPSSQTGMQMGAVPTQQTPALAVQAPSVTFAAGQSELQQPITPMRRAIMDNMIASKQTSAHVTTFFEIDYSRIEAVRAKHKNRFRAQEGVSLTYTAFLTAAVSQCLKRHSYLNAQLKQDKILFKKEIHLGIAVAIQDPEPGLLVPVIRHADRMNLRGLARSIADLAQRSRTRRIAPDELFGGTFTISNPGSHGGLVVTPIINQPQVAILGVGSIERRPKVVQTTNGEALAICTMGLLSLSFDHRLVDGVTADAFMADLKQTLETWNTEP
ncbi:MAG: dihydrolipoamide acetyltransferase family protein, partial [Myxococcota bacterium]